MEEKERNEILKKEAERSEKIRRRMEREERRRQRKQQRKNLDEEEMNKKIEIEERKLLVAQRKLESIRLLDELLERVKVIFSVFNMTASSSASSITTTLISMISPSAEVLIVSMEMVIASFHICRHKDWISLTFLNGRCIFYVENFSKLFLLHLWTFGDDKTLVAPMNAVPIFVVFVKLGAIQFSYVHKCVILNFHTIARQACKDHCFKIIH